MKSFDEWFEKQDIDNWTNKKFMLKAFEAGQQSKQAEVDELQKRIDEAIELLEYNEYADSPLQALNILKGETHER